MIELLGGTLVIAGLVTGAVQPSVVLLFLGLSIVVGFMLSWVALLIEERTYDRYPGWRDLGRLLRASVYENAGYRQLMTVVRARAWVTAATRRGAWGEMVRIGIGEESAPIRRAPRNPRGLEREPLEPVV